ncbi:unnamed protein product [Somion occarium]|uniref:Uncharacterized protein n=1 Tax=Somion occarium TaxID=3059160 RepID=A0ABP1DXB1_9APHY
MATFYDSAMGIRVGMEPPLDLSEEPGFADTDCGEVQICLMVLNVNDPTVCPQHRPWFLYWTVGHPPVACRVLRIVKEPGFEHYTNWGPVTIPDLLEDGDSDSVRVVPIGRFNLRQRLQWERVANETTVPMFDFEGKYDGQAWIVDVFNRAIKCGLMTPMDAQRYLQKAREC